MMDNTTNISRFFDHIIGDDLICPSHISLYTALLQFWSLNQFQSPFRICRIDLMKLSKIRSIATYHKCMKELHVAGLIIYSPSYDSYKGSVVEINDLKKIETSTLIFCQDHKTSPHSSFSIPTVNEVRLYFSERGLAPVEADQFHSVYQSNDWELASKKPMKSWQAAARNWISERKKQMQKNTDLIYVL